MTWLLWILVAYACGSIPFGVLIARSQGVDIRSVGSGNIGATNVGRVLGRSFGIACFFLDALKGALPVAFAGWTQGILGNALQDISAQSTWLWLATAMAAILGHSFSPWLGMRGGKGVATGFGATFAMWPVMTIAAGIAFLVWGIMLGLSRMMSLASIIAASTLPVVVVVEIALEGAPASGLPFLLVTLLLAAFVTFRHRANIARIRKGEEPKIGQGSRGSDSAGKG